MLSSTKSQASQNFGNPAVGANNIISSPRIFPPIIPFPPIIIVPKPQPKYTWNFLITVRSSRKIVFYNSPSHKINKIKTSEDGLVNVFALDKDTIPNRDFVFVYTPEEFNLPAYVVGQNNDSTTILVSFIPKFSEVKVEDAYKKLQDNKTAQFDITAIKGEYIFILDRSGSMDGTRMEKAKQALIIFLRSLPSDSYFNIISFGSSYEKMYPESIRYENKKMKEAVSKIERMSANFGGTQIYFPLENALDQAAIDGYPRFIFLLTDGTVSNTEGVIQMAKKKSRYSRISSIGIGNGASLRLIEGSADAGKGKFVMISDSENPSEKIISLLESSLTPLIKKIVVNYDKTDLQSIVPNPATLPYILKDSIVNFYLTYNTTITEPKVISLQYEDSFTNKLYKSTITIDPKK